jgi:hypothetical protein
MAYPDLYKDELKILEAQNIKVKSVSFNAVLTNRRLILVDSKKQMLAPQEILLATLKNVDSGENAIRDPTITVSIITNTGTTRQMILTFSKTSGGERKRECDEWVRALRQHVSQTIQHHPILPDIPSLEEEETLPALESIPAAPQSPRIEIVNAPPQKKRIEISRPIKKIVETAPAMPQPVETTSLPTGSFCNRCGSRVPPESAFCNRCGTPVVKESDLEAVLRTPVPGPAVSPPETAAHEPEVPQVAVPLPPVFGLAADKKERPIEEVIQSIEPLIEDSVPRTEPAPLVPRPASYHPPEPVVPEPVVPQPVAAEQAVPAATNEIQWPVITPSAATPGTPSSIPETPVPPPSPMGSSGKGKTRTIAIAALVILVVVAGIFIIANPLQIIRGDTSVVTPVPATIPAVTTIPATTAVTVVTTPVPETTILPVTTPANTVPASGVWVRVSYPNKYSGTVGIPNAQREVGDYGEKFYQISTSTGTVAVSVQKTDGSAEPLTVEIFKDGELVMKKSTVAPKGIVEFQVSLKPAATPTPVLTTPVVTATPEVSMTVAVNTTASG